MDRDTKKVIVKVVVVAVSPVLTGLTWSVYKGLQPHDSPVPVVFKLPTSTSSSAAMMVVERKP
jgi:hypothetical protein